MSEIKQSIGDLIRKNRKAKGLTQKELGGLLGMNESRINRYEKGKQNLTVETLQKIAESLGVDLHVDFK